MRAVVQRVSRGEVRVDGKPVGAVGTGFVVLLGVAKDDGEADARAMADKLAGLRVFTDAAGKMNLALAESSMALVVFGSNSASRRWRFRNRSCRRVRR